MPKDENMDSFWDIGDLLPPKKAKPKAPSSPFSPEATSPCEIAVGDAPPQEKGAKIPPRTERSSEKPKRELLREYTPSAGFIKKVSVVGWPTEFGFYQKFRLDALRYFEKSHEKREYVYFFSYMPQYEQMTYAQLAYYLYWRSEVRLGRYIKTDNSYLFLYIYEIINLPDKIPPKDGVRMLSALWRAYRDTFRYLDKYLGDWLCDYCFIHGVTPDYACISDFTDEIIGRVSLPEFYLQEGGMTPTLIHLLSAYDFKKSKYYADHAEEFERHIPRAASAAIGKCVIPYLDSYGIRPISSNRDSFAGAIAYRPVKCKITLTLCPLRHSAELRQLVTNVVKLCENHLRAAFSIKSRFSPAGIREDVAREISAYFDAYYPDRFLNRKRKASEGEEAYMALYEPEEKGPADIERALKIEQDAWETASLIDGDDAEEAVPMQTVQTPPPFTEADESESSGDMMTAFLSALGSERRAALSAALQGDLAAFCHRAGKMPARMKDEIDALASETLGDIVLCEDLTVLDDYKEDITAALAAYSEA